MLIKSSIQQEVLAILNAYALNNKTPKYMRQKLMQLKRELEKFIIVSTDFNIPLIVIYSTVDITLTRI